MKKAIFLVGGPGSGKDIVIKQVLHNYELQEFKLEQIKNASLSGENEIIITANAYNFEEILITKNLLEENGFETSMIFVDVNEKVSKQRIVSRNINEEIRTKKLRESKKNINKFSKEFSYFLVVENNSNNIIPNKEELIIFCESFINLETVLFEKTSNKTNNIKRSIKDKLLKSYPTDLLSKVQTDRIGDEYSIRNSGMGFPSTVGPFYTKESFADYAPELPAFTSDERTIPPENNSNNTIEKTPQSKRIQNIKKIAKNCWKRG